MTTLNMEKAQVGRAVDALIQYLQKKGSTDAFLDESQPINLQLGLKKIPKEKNKTVKICLPHSFVTSTSEVCLFVKDLDKKNKDFEPTKQHFQELLDDKGITCVNEIIPLKSLKTEYQPFEAKRNLSNMFDVYLADERIVRLLPGFLGKSFYSRKKFPVQINVNAKDLKAEVEKALSTTICSMTGKGSMSQVTIGSTVQKKAQLVDNIMAAVSKLEESVAGGSVNIRSLHIKSVDSPSLPVYISLDSANDVELPVKKRKQEFIEPEDVTPIIHGKVRVTPRGGISIVNTATAKTDEDKEFLISAKKTKKEEKNSKKKPLKEVNERKDEGEVVKSKGKKKRKLSEGQDNTPNKKGAKRKASEDVLVTEESVSPKKKKTKVGTPKSKKDSEDNASLSLTTPNQKIMKKKPKTPTSATSKVNIREDTEVEVSSTKKTKTPKSEKKIEKSAKKTPKSVKKSPSAKDTPTMDQKTPKSAKKSVAKDTPTMDKKTPKSAKKSVAKDTPTMEKKTPKSAKKSPVAKDTPTLEKKTPKSELKKNKSLDKIDTPKSAKKTNTPKSVKKTPKSAKKSPKLKKATPKAS